MFVKKDTRKVLEILADPEDERRQLKLARREAEFRGSAALLCDKKHAAALMNVEYLSLYANRLPRLDGFGVLTVCPLRQLNLGDNMLEVMPKELASLSLLEDLWLEDNRLAAFPKEILSLTRLRTLRLSGNLIGSVPHGINALTDLEVLALDRNRLETLPESSGDLSKLHHLQLSGNALTALPESFPLLMALQFLGLNSNCLTDLPEAMGNLSNLETLYLNANGFTTLPESMANMKALKKLNVANCRIASLPPAVAKAWAKSLPADVLASLREGDAAMGDEVVTVDDADDDGEAPALSVDFTNNPVSTDPGVGLSETQFSQPLTTRWVKKLKS